MKTRRASARFHSPALADWRGPGFSRERLPLLFRDGLRAIFESVRTVRYSTWSAVNPIMISEAREVRRLACQEVRGGNHEAAYEAELPGLNGWISCRPLGPTSGGGDVYYMSACSQGV